VPADDMMQAFAYRHLVPAQELKVALWGRSMSRTPVQILTATPLRIPISGTARVEVVMPISPLMGKIEFELNDAPDGIAIKEFSTGRDHAELVLQTDPAKLRPGLKGNLVIQAFAEHSPQSSREEPSVNRRRVPLGALPAIPFETVGR
jgi:hypothetical protein